MAIGVTFFIIAAAIVLIWFFVEIKRLKHKLWAIFLIGLILFTYLSFTASLKNSNVDLDSVGGVVDAGKLYVSWLSGVFVNLKSVTAFATKQDWQEYDAEVVNDSTEFEDIWAMLN